MGSASRHDLSLDELAPAWDHAVDATPGVDEFCASSLWAFSAAESFPAAGEPLIVTDGTGFCGMRESTTADGVEVLVGLDPVWGFATPCVGPPPAAANALVAVLSETDRAVAVVGGQREDSVLSSAIVARLDRRHLLLKGPEEVRIRADLDDGFEGWFRRRSSRFRQRLRRIERDAAAREVAVTDVSSADPDAVIDRILAIEARSWKQAAGTGLISDDLAHFYRVMAWRLARHDALRTLVAVAPDGDGTIDIGYILGGVRASTYRGLQVSYAADWAELGIGHLLQLHQLRAVAAEGITTYDLGMDMPYKRRWADGEHRTFSVIAVRDDG